MDRLRRALCSVLRRHELLRTLLKEAEGREGSSGLTAGCAFLGVDPVLFSSARSLSAVEQKSVRPCEPVH